MHVVAGFTGSLLSLTEIGSEVTVKEGDIVLGGFSLGDFTDEVVLLIWADEEGGCKAVEAIFGGVFCRTVETDIVAFLASVLQIGIDKADEFTKTIVINGHKRHVDILSVENQGVTASLIFGVGMNIRVVPEAGDVDVLFPQSLNAHQ